MPDKITKFIEYLNEKTKLKLKAKLLALKENPFATKDVKKMKGMENLYRLRMGKIRIVYTIISGDIVITSIGYRGDIY